MTIEYVNLDMEPISLQQLELVKEYYKIYKIDGLLKKIESYFNNQLEDIEYYLSENELIDEVFTAEGTDTLAIVTNVPYNQYVVQTTTYYINGIAGSIDKQLFYDGMVLCLLEKDASGNVDFQSSRKYLYDEDGEEQFMFSYNQDGSLKSISGFSYPFSEFNQTLDASEIPTYFPNLLIENPYYNNFDFYLNKITFNNNHMPNTIAKRHYPRLSEVVTLEDIPPFLTFVESRHEKISQD